MCLFSVLEGVYLLGWGVTFANRLTDFCLFGAYISKWTDVRFFFLELGPARFAGVNPGGRVLFV